MSEKHIILARVWAVAGYIWFVLIAVLSLLPSDNFASFSWSHLIGLDKVGHAIFYGVFYVLHYQSRSAQDDKRKYYPLFAAGAAMYGVILELLQSYMYLGRHFDVLDLIANIIGLLIALGITGLLNK
ncbi:MAG: VanZ family protein [Saprospiraceae bacterium]|nr:VanZ family protein [Saprospiraceae bacterium]